MATRQQLQLRAIRLLGETHRLLKAAKSAGMPERAELARKAEKTARRAYAAVDQVYAWRPGK